LVSVRGTLGGVCVVHSDMAGWNISREVAMVDVKTDVVSADFVALYIATNKAQSWLTGMLKGAAYKGINLSDLRKLELPLPTLEIQKEVIREVNQVELSFRKCLTNYQSKLADLDELRQSLLQKAFAGELT
ncbi:MAG: restriction endonuclease subunit S, partial [Halocynthiibacter sp.]